jgi:Family of unknown function (DUF6529)
MTSTQPASPARDRYAVPLLVAVLGGCLVALVLGLYSRLHHPSGFALDVAGFSSALYAKAWLTTFAAAFAVVQVVTGRRANQPGHAAWIPTVHRYCGRIAILLTVPVVVHCIYALGFQTYSTRVLVHSVLGCFFYGAFVAKMLSLTWRGLNAPMGSPGTWRYGLPRADRRVADLVRVAVHQQGMALLTMRVGLPVTKGERRGADDHPHRHRAGPWPRRPVRRHGHPDPGRC